MKMILGLIFMIYSISSMACWKLEAQIDIAGEHLSINQKIVHGRVYSFASGPYLIDIEMPEAKNLLWSVTEKKSLKLKKLFSQSLAVRLNTPLKHEGVKIDDTQSALMTFKVSEI